MLNKQLIKCPSTSRVMHPARVVYSSLFLLLLLFLFLLLLLLLLLLFH